MATNKPHTNTDTNNALGARPVSAITPPEVLAVLRKIEARGKLETAGRLRAVVGQVFHYAIATGRAENDPTPSLRGALTAPITKPRAALVQPIPFGGLLRAIEDYYSFGQFVGRSKGSNGSLSVQIWSGRQS